jgi:adenine-specific DNA-methyltransferase
MSKTTKLELTWIGKDNRPQLEPRILMEDSSKSYHAKTRLSETDIFDNELIFGDNLLALKALEQDFSGRIKCVYIDPPYNTGTAFAQYDDGLEHSLWLSLMRDRLEILRRLLRNDGSVWINIDDNEAHYLKIICDEIFGRPNFIANVVWQKRLQPDMRATMGAGHDHILVYAKDRDRFKEVLNLLEKSQDRIEQYKNPDNDPRGPWVSADFMAKGYRPNQMYKIVGPSGAVYEPRPGSCWRNIESVYKKLHEEGRIWYGKDGSSMPRKKTYLSETEGHSAWSWWPNSEVGHNQEAKKESNALFGAENAFETPKPERLIRRVIELATDEGEFVLDSFAGSGTTGAVAHKLHRRWIMIELREHCHTHIIPRLRKVIEGTDKGGITEAVGWKGGGGFRYYRLAPSLLEKDRFANWIISKQYNPAMLAEAMCKFEGFTYAPSDTEYWIHGHSTERDFIYVTTQTLTREQLHKLSDEVGENRSLLVCCSAFRVKDVSQFANLTIKKIPKMVLSRCEWGRDDYSLEIKNLPQASAPPEPAPIAPTNGSTQTSSSSMNLFEAVEEGSHSR